MDELRERAQPLLDTPLVPPTPIVELRRRARRRRAYRAILAVAVAAGLVTAGVLLADSRGTSRANRVAVVPTTPRGTTPTTAARPLVGAPDSFVSIRGKPGTNDWLVAISDARTGKMTKLLRLVPSSNGSFTTGTAIAPDGDIWITVNRGPRSGGDTAGGDPQPHSCASTVWAIDPRTRAAHVVMRGGDNELIEDVQPSPDGSRIAFLHSTCVGFYFDNSLEIKDLASGHIVSVGAALSPCHIISTPRWTADGRTIALQYAPGGPPKPTDGPGVCSSGPGASHLVTVSSDHSQGGVDATTAPNDSDCDVNAIAVTASGFAGVEHCGGNFAIDGPVRLVRYDRALRPVSRVPLGKCENGASIAGNPNSDAVVVSTYQFCGGPASPVTKVFTDDGHALRRILALPGGNTEVDVISF